MAKIFIISLLIFPLFAQAEEINWVEESTVNADINCDGIDDKSKIGYKGSEVVIQIHMGKSEEKYLMEFGLIGSNKNIPTLCSSKAFLSREDPPKVDYPDFIYGLGEVPEGHVCRKGCFDLNLSGGGCDSIHIYWNHTSNQLSHWRL